ncbi:MAG: phosphohistidine phosphatase SixA [Deinococcales bacterium]
MELWVVRHAKAGHRGPEWPDDRERTLTPAGERQAARLAGLLERMEVRFDRLFCSPWVRAAQTAEPLRVALASGRHVEHLDALTAGDPLALVAALNAEVGADDACVAVVGHEPQLSLFGSLILTGRGDGMLVSFGKAGALVLEGDVAPGRMALRALLPASVVASLRSRA